MAKFSETVYLDQHAKVDRESGEIRGVKLLGEDSRNNRRYLKTAMQAAVSKYEGKKVYVDHPSETANDRSMDRWAGTIKNARYESDGIYGDVKLRKKSGFFEGILEAAQDFPSDVGFSHVADGESRMDKDTEIVESIKEVFSVDLVTDPATTHGFFESKKKQPRTVKQAVESLPAGATRTRLIEMMDGGYMDGSLEMDEKEMPADPLSQMSSLVKELITMLGETLKALAMKKDSPDPIVAAAADPADEAAEKKPEGDEKPEGLEGKKPDENKPAFESLQRENSELKAKTLLLETGREATPPRIKALANTADDAERCELLESWPTQESASEWKSFRSPAATVQADASPERIRESFAALAR